MEPITKESVEQVRGKGTKRICFATTHSAEPKRTSQSKSSDFFGTINVPFGSGFKELFPFPLYRNTRDTSHEDAYWYGIKTEEEFKKIDAWVKQQGNRVFLRDCLYVSVAMSHNFTEDLKTRTEIGDLEYRAKKNRDMTAVAALAEHCINTITDFPLYKEADLVCAIPPGLDKEFDLPSRVTSIVSDKLSRDDITDHFNFGAKKEPLKGVSYENRWAVWEDARLTFDGVDIDDKKIILIDDKYQSGTTMQYIAMKLQERGACQVYGLSMVKTMRDTDNL